MQLHYKPLIVNSSNLEVQFVGAIENLQCTTALPLTCNTVVLSEIVIILVKQCN